MASPSEPLLLLFDIDGTLLDTGGAGLTSIAGAAEEHFADHLDSAGGVPPLDLAGSTDGGIVRYLYKHFGEAYTASGETAFYQTYLRHLKANLGHERYGDVGLLPGVPALLKVLASTEGVTLALLTGNIREGAFRKVAHYSIGHHFSDGAFGDDHPDRNELGAIAMKRMGDQFTPENTVVIGDTPKDIRCARACGAKAVAVATGKFSAGELEEFEADVLLENFSDTAAAVSALVG
ncbi:HAD family hydrolase [Verrucomicrobiales bacterium]|nr:HAD family hydrolase [Verrucomicrobiales bacterium]